MSRQGKKPDKSGDRQLSLFDPRVKLKQYLREIVIPSFSYFNSRGKEVHVKDTATMKMLLIAIEDHCGFKAGEEPPGFWLYLKQIAVEIGSKPRKEGKSIEDVDTTRASRAIAACEAAGLLIVGRSFYKHEASFYKVNWCVVKQMILDNPFTEHLINSADPMRSRESIEGAAANDPQTVKVEGDATHGDTETTHCKSPFTHGELPLTHCKSPLTHGDLQSLADVDTTSSRTRGFTHGSNHEKKPKENHDDIAINKTSITGFEEVDWSGFAGWPYKLEKEHLQDPFKVQLLWEYALKKGFGRVTPGDRMNFFRLVSASLQPVVKNAGGYLTTALKRIQDYASTWPTDDASHQCAVKSTCRVDLAKEFIKSGKFSADAEKLLKLYRDCFNRGRGN